MRIETASVLVDYRQFYIYGADDFDSSTVDDLTDGLLAPRGGGARVVTSVQHGRVPVEARVVDSALVLPQDAVASASNLRLSEAEVTITDFGGPARFRHRFDKPIAVCSVLVERLLDPERYTITFSPEPLTPSRWRSDALARAHPDRPDQWPATVDLEQDEDESERLDLIPDTPTNRYREADIEAMIWGGRTPGGRLRDIGDVAAGVAGMDRAFADELASASDTTLRRIAVDLVVGAALGHLRRRDVEAIVATATGTPAARNRHADAEPDVPPPLPDALPPRARALLAAACDPHAGRAAFRTLWLAAEGRASDRYFAHIASTYLVPPSDR